MVTSQTLHSRHRMRLFAVKSWLATLLLSSLLNHFVLAEVEIIASVNGQPITKKIFNQYQKARRKKQPGTPLSLERKLIINELIHRELLYQDALKQQLDEDPDIAFTIQTQRVNLLVTNLVNKILAAEPITEEILKKEYEEKISKAKISEYKARHILLKNEADAKTLIDELDKGADFASLAKQKSTGPSGKQGGDLGWFVPSAMVAPFSKAILEMKKGSYSKTPVKTKFGYHIIKLEDTRAVKPPKFKEVKQQLRGALQNKLLKEYLDKLHKSADIKIN